MDVSIVATTFVSSSKQVNWFVSLTLSLTENCKKTSYIFFIKLLKANTHLHGVIGSSLPPWQG